MRSSGIQPSWSTSNSRVHFSDIEAFRHLMREFSVLHQFLERFPEGVVIGQASPSKFVVKSVMKGKVKQLTRKVNQLREQAT